MTGIMVLGHGSKAPAALKTLKDVTKALAKELSAQPVEYACMSINDPRIPEVMEKLVKQGAKKVIILPFFLYFGIHMQEDIPRILDKERSKYSDVEIVLADNIGADSRLVNILIDRVKEVK